MEVIYLYNEELDTLQELTEVTNSKLIEIASEVSKELTERVNEAWDKLPNFKGDPTTKCEEVDELFAQNNSEIEPVAKTATEDCISRQAAIEAVSLKISEYEAPYKTAEDKDIMSVVMRTGLRLAQDIIESLPPVEPIAESATTTDEVVDFNNLISVGRRLRNLPPVELKRPKREWMFNPKDAIDSMFSKPKCPECGFESADGGNFCSNCGADMGGVE